MSDKMIKRSTIYLDWINCSEDDLAYAKKALRDEECICPALFSTQQCAEKALKAYLAYQQQPINKIHDLIELVVSCAKFDQSFNMLMTYAESLNPYQIKTRYPGLISIIPTVQTLKASIDEAEQVLNFVKERVGDKR